MGVFYTMSGSVIVTNVTQVHTIVDRFNKQAPSDMLMSIVENVLDPDMAEVTVEGGGEMSEYTVEALDNICKELSPFALEAAHLETSFGGDNMLLYIGSHDDEPAAISKDALDQATRSIEHLNQSDALKLVYLLLPKLDETGLESLANPDPRLFMKS